MKCKNCGGPIIEKNGSLICEYCDSEYIKEEFEPKKVINEFIINARTIQYEFTIRGGVLIGYNGSKSQVVIPDGVIQIGANAFKNNLAINKVTFSDSVKTVGESAFFGCVNLLEICNYQNVQSFEDDCFYGAGLESVKIGTSVCNLGKNCFANMPNLKTVVYTPNKNLKLNKTFAYCKNLTKVNMDKFYCFPSVRKYLELKNNRGNTRYTYSDGFLGTPYYPTI